MSLSDNLSEEKKELFFVSILVLMDESFRREAVFWDMIKEMFPSLF